MQAYWFKSTLARLQKVGTLQILGSVTSMTGHWWIRPSPLFRTSYYSFLNLGNFICTNVQSKVVEVTGISRSSLQ
jgi:hypothetical protein